MASCVLLCEALVLSVAIINSLSSGIVEGRSITKEEYLQMKEHMKFLNKPAVKSIQTTYGDIFDCVDIYKQPALDHPLLRNHTIQMRPNTYPKGIKINEASSSKAPNLALKNGGCPLGTIPIRRTQMYDMVRSTSLSKFGKKFINDQSMHHYAKAEIKGQYYGARVTINLWNPRVQGTWKSWTEFSLVQMWVVAGAGNQLNTIEAGWMVYRRIFGDYHTRLFIYWTSSQTTIIKQVATICYAKDFVQVNKDIGLGGTLEPVSVYNGTQTSITLYVFQDKKDENWWLAVGSGIWVVAVGYWPKELFNFLNIKADKVAWGGEVYGESPLPEMGSGHFPSEGYGKAAYIKEIQIIDQSKVVRDFDLLHDQCEYFVDKPGCYLGYPVTQDPMGTFILFGGPGGNCS
ncbi:uncharacterized protein LOC122076438 [Macadamia integrifolia]|uniref:uncharacterized protein LOC122076438 n=1 Tax=Macadamia integrifolia TaxID=60698 RepID=UPI001C4FB82E|nr:uncharacterized protein LOC122076438 [Macadamia integrifolia]